MYQCERCYRVKQPIEFTHNPTTGHTRLCNTCNNKIHSRKGIKKEPSDWTTLFCGEGNWFGAYFERPASRTPIP